MSMEGKVELPSSSKQLVNKTLRVSQSTDNWHHSIHIYYKYNIYTMTRANFPCMLNSQRDSMSRAHGNVGQSDPP